MTWTRAARGSPVTMTLVAWSRPKAPPETRAQRRMRWGLSFQMRIRLDTVKLRQRTSSDTPGPMPWTTAAHTAAVPVTRGASYTLICSRFHKGTISSGRASRRPSFTRPPRKPKSHFPRKYSGITRTISPAMIRREMSSFIRYRNESSPPMDRNRGWVRRAMVSRRVKNASGRSRAVNTALFKNLWVTGFSIDRTSSYV